MSVGGAGIPRLQDLSYIDVAAGGVAAGATFEQLRRSLVARGAELARDSDTDGSFDEQRWSAVRADPTKYVHNTVDVLKELMRLGWVERHILPSGPASAYAHSESTFTMTPAGAAWTELAGQDRRSAYNSLLGVEGLQKITRWPPYTSTPQPSTGPGRTPLWWTPLTDGQCADRLRHPHRSCRRAATRASGRLIGGGQSSRE
ncbi:hypothetical protein [Pseudonocardia alni]|uniref:hypothetical protein n=1 Tax=Pseudonocardia alni TaxID=33907 RepID=UPI0027A9D5B3|nr:hypothetical protein PaSha_18760 [Pseudonocardia alni]